MDRETDLARVSVRLELIHNTHTILYPKTYMVIFSMLIVLFT